MRWEQTSVTARRTMPPAVAVSTVAFALHPPAGAEQGGSSAAHDAAMLWIPLVRRTRMPFRGLWALPGGPTQWDETLTGTAMRTLVSAVQRAPGYLEQLYSFGGIERSANAQRLVTIAYWALYGESGFAGEPGRPDPNVAWFSADALPELAFDHAEIADYALARLRSKTEYAAVAHHFLGETFTLAQLRSVHEAVRGRPVDPANFRRQALAQGNLIDTGRLETGTGHRPARLYRFAAAAADAAADATAEPSASSG